MSEIQQSNPRIAISREMLVQYIQATVVGGVGKKVAYTSFINPLERHPSQAAHQLESRNEYHELKQTIIDNDDIVLKKTSTRLRSKYASMVERNIEVATSMLDEAEDNKEKSQAVRLVNETVQALAVIGGTSEPVRQNIIDKGSAVVQQ